MKKSTPKERRSAGPLQVLKLYTREVGRTWWLFALVMIAVTGLQIVSLISPLYLRQFFNIISTGEPGAATIHTLLITIVWIGGLGLGAWILQRLQSLSTIYMESYVMSDLYVSAFDYLIKHSHHFFISQFAGTLTRRVSKYAGSFETLIDSFVGSFVPTILYVVGAIGILFARNHVLGLLLAAWSIFFLIFQVYVSRLRQPVRAQRAEEDSALAGTFADAISNQNTIAIFSGGAHEHDNTSAAVGRWRAITLRSWVTDDYIWGAQGFLMVLINISLLYGALRFWERGELTVGDFVLIQSYLLGIFGNLNSITRDPQECTDPAARRSDLEPRFRIRTLHPGFAGSAHAGENSDRDCASPLDHYENGPNHRARARHRRGRRYTHGAHRFRRLVSQALEHPSGRFFAGRVRLAKRGFFGKLGQFMRRYLR